MAPESNALRSLPRLVIAGSVMLALTACAGGVANRSSDADEATRDTEAAERVAATERERQARPPAEGDIPYFRDGSLAGHVSPESAAERGLTLIELGEEWTPSVFREDPALGEAGRQPYRRRFLRLADEQTAAARRDPSARYLELFGIFPTLRVLRERIADDERHRCHAEIDNAPIEALDRALRPGADLGAQRRRARAFAALERRLEQAAERRGVESIEALEGDRRHARDLRRWRSLADDVQAVRAVQAHLRCDDLLSSRAQDGVLDGWTAHGIRAFQARHMIIALASSLDEATRRALVTDSRELDLLSLLRSLRERVVAATGRIEDGTAVGRFGEVAGRRIDLDDELHWSERLEPLPDGAGDLVAEVTDAAARALGWTDPAAARAWLDAHAAEPSPSRWVAVPLPPPPAYHAEHMELRVEIDRGDVWYGFPYTDTGRPRGMAVRNRPLVILYAQHEGREIPLVRWNTTIGGWQPEINPEGGVGMRYKESDVGPRVWRDVIASPAWLPPPSTPDRELLRRRGDRWVPHRSITGPGYDSAYGMAMIIHHFVRGEGEREEDWMDRGIRTHGSVSYRSILRGTSHGCHRLFNHLAVRLTSFLLSHRRHRVHGRIPALFRRELRPPESDERPVLEIDSRGFRFELDPPVPVEVLRGNVRGRPQRPLAGFYPLPEELQAQAREAAEADPAP